MKRGGPAALIVVLASLLVWVFLYFRPADEGHGITLARLPTGGDFVLQSYQGPVSLQGLRGKLVALFFGYTHCPDICPTNMGFLSVALDGLSPEERARVQGIFISVDPERDTLEKLKDYGEYFSPWIVGVTGSPAELAEVAARYGAAYRRVELGSEMGYGIDHTAYTYLLDGSGRVRETLPHGTPPAELRRVMQRLLAEVDGGNLQPEAQKRPPLTEGDHR